MGKLPFKLQNFSTLVYNFDTQLFPSVGALRSSCTNISGTVSNSKNSMDSAAGGIASSWTSEAGVSVKGALQDPIIAGLDRIDNSMNGSLLSIIDKIESLGDPVTEIKAMISTANTLKEGEWKEWTSIFGVKHRTYEKNDDDLIEKYYNSIKGACTEVESSIKSLAAASSESLGIVGNVCGGAPLGSYTPMDLTGVNTEIAIAAVERQKSFFTKVAGNVGAFAIGVSETPFKLVEGVVDAGATLVADAVSLFGGDASGIVDFIEKDHVGDAVNSVAPWVADYELARSIGNVAGELAVVAVTAGSGSAALAAAKAVGNAGRISETVLNITNGNLALATGAAIVVGLTDYKTTRKLQGRVVKPKSTPSTPKPSSPDVAGHLPSGENNIAGHLPAGENNIAGYLNTASENVPDFSSMSVNEVLNNSVGRDIYTNIGKNLGIKEGMSWDAIRDLLTAAYKNKTISGGEREILLGIFCA